MAARRSRVRIPTHHARQFGFARLPAHFTNLRRPVAFLDDEVLVPKRSNLSQVRHDDDLARCGESLQPCAYLRRCLPADATITAMNMITMYI